MDLNKQYSNDLSKHMEMINQLVKMRPTIHSDAFTNVKT